MPASWKNWSGSVRCSPREIAMPADLEGIVATVRRAGESGGKLRIVGTGHSFTPLVATDETLLSLDHFSGIEQVDRERGEATVRAGTKLWRLNDLLDAEGLAMENLGDINRQSVAGALSTGTHGTGARFGVLATQAIGLTLVTPSGEVLELSESREPELFKAAQVSLGALGVIVKARLRLVPAYTLHYVRRRGRLEEALEKVEEFRQTNRHFEMFYFPHTEGVLLKFLNDTDRAPNEPKIRKFISDVVLENALFGFFSACCRVYPPFCKTVDRLSATLVSEGEEFNRSHRVFSTARMVKFNEMEYSIPAEAAPQCLREIKRWIAAEDLRVSFPIELRYAKGDDIYLSPAHGRDSAFLALHMLTGMPREKYFGWAEGLFRERGGRPHWGKMHNRCAADLAPAYPMWEKFRQARRKLDPSGALMNPHLERILGPAA